MLWDKIRMFARTIAFPLWHRSRESIDFPTLGTSSLILCGVPLPWDHENGRIFSLVLPAPCIPHCRVMLGLWWSLGSPTGNFAFTILSFWGVYLGTMLSQPFLEQCLERGAVLFPTLVSKTVTVCDLPLSFVNTCKFTILSDSKNKQNKKQKPHNVLSFLKPSRGCCQRSLR